MLTDNNFHKFTVKNDHKRMKNLLVGTTHWVVCRHEKNFPNFYSKRVFSILVVTNNLNSASRRDIISMALMFGSVIVFSVL